ncbi:hypothetical protein DNTS_021016 [Danionella cerebrum]|uniref:RRP15-like protein n=1 Tax=Danionella cerebrum TaxID=2873325 RepID=A0A553NKL4_9TELE|nr:hypothetical protein DNTS_021016 [Danionella translucida]
MAAITEKPHVVLEDENDQVSEDSISAEEYNVIIHDEEGSDVGSDKESDGDDEQDNKEEKEGDSEENPNSGWADAMAKVLGKKTPQSKPSILLKNKQMEKVRAKEKKERLERKKKLEKKRMWENICREKPDVVRDRERERNLQRIATRGVVQLFNALNKHKKNIDVQIKDAGPSDRKKSKIMSSVSKKDFIDILRGTDVSHNITIKKEKECVEVKEENPSWSVLRDDFMIGTSMKDWDKESDEDGDGGDEEGKESHKAAEECSSESD